MEWWFGEGRFRIDSELPVVGMLLFEVVLRLHFRIAVLDNIRQPRNDLLNFDARELRADPDDKTSDT